MLWIKSSECKLCLLLTSVFLFFQDNVMSSVLRFFIGLKYMWSFPSLMASLFSQLVNPSWSESKCDFVAHYFVLKVNTPPSYSILEQGRIFKKRVSQSCFLWCVSQSDLKKLSEIWGSFSWWGNMTSLTLRKRFGFKFPHKSHIIWPHKAATDSGVAGAFSRLPWYLSSGALAQIARSQLLDKSLQTPENMGCAVPEMLFKEASVLSIWQLFILAVALSNNNSHDNCFSYIKMLPSLFPTTFCLSGMRVPMLLRSSQTVVYVLSLLRVNRHDLSGEVTC